jgi:hypothetical protein
MTVIIPFPVVTSAADGFWLHVTPKGRELRYRIEPTLCPTIHIWTVRDNEYTVTHSVVDDGCRIIPVTPPGRRWMRCDLPPDSVQQQLKKDRPSQVWVRRARQ